MSSLASPPWTLSPLPSQITAAGTGLFLAAGRIPQDSTLLFYTGTLLTTAQVFKARREDTASDGGYLMRLGMSSHSGIVWIDAESDPTILARYINDPLLPLAYNVKFVKRPESSHAEVVATRDIVEGEELFVDYGAGYWRGVSYKPTKLKAVELGGSYVRIRGKGAQLPTEQCVAVADMYVRQLVKNAPVAPDMLSDHAFYTHAYQLRREASTMQPRGVAWLNEHAGEVVGEVDGRVKMLSVGPGDGELDLSFLKGLGKAGVKEVELLGLEPNKNLREDFAERIERQGKEVGHEVRLVDEIFPKSDGSVVDGSFDVVLLGHVLYYFGSKDETAQALLAAVKAARPGGKVVVVHQAAVGVPELQGELLPWLRGTMNDVLTADDIERLLGEGELKAAVGGMERHDVDAWLDLTEVRKEDSDDGIAIMSFCLEADLRKVGDCALRKCREAFLGKSEQREGGRLAMREPVVAFVIRPKVEA